MRAYVVIQGRSPANGDPAPVELSAKHCLRIVPEAQSLTLVQSTIALTASAVNLGDTETREAVGGWELVSASAWLVGDVNGQARPVAALEPWSPPSSTLAGVWAKSASGSISLIATGGVAS